MRRTGILTGLLAAILAGACGGGGSTASPTTTSTASKATTSTTSPTPAKEIDTTYPSAALHSNRRVVVLLPPGYQSTKRYPVVEFLHGAPGDPSQMIGLGMRTVSTQSKVPFIAVAPDGNGPVVSESDFANSTRQPMGTVTGPELRSWVNSQYATNGTWYVTGFSSGGFGAAYLPTLSPGAYKAACPISGSFTAQTPPFEGDPAFAGQPASVTNAASPILHVSRSGPPTLVVVGSTDAPGLDQAHRYVAAMTAVGQPNKLIIDPGGHEAQVWIAGIAQCVGYFFPGSGVGQ
ncbi:MAG TPA: alpha/beta hydrolase-fold protein [Acidimicrobiales bacterium]|nr:alpha/beta hydrolase-fold protein [Acidimicrobiales bacterium]